jgi:hypothetical protein
MKLTLTCTTLLMTFFFLTAAQDFKKQFNDLIIKNDTVGQLELL